MSTRIVTARRPQVTAGSYCSTRTTLRQSFHMGLEKPQRPLMSRLGLGSGRAVPACGCALTPLYICCCTATHLLICPGQFGNRENFVIGVSCHQEVPLAALHRWCGGWVGVTEWRKAAMSQVRTCRQDCVQRPDRPASPYLESSGAAVWSGAGSKCTDTRLWRLRGAVANCLLHINQHLSTEP